MEADVSGLKHNVSYKLRDLDKVVNVYYSQISNIINVEGTINTYFEGLLGSLEINVCKAPSTVSFP